MTENQSTQKFRLGIAGLVHDHVWDELAKWHATGQIEIVAGADANEPLRDRLQKEFGVPHLFSSFEEMLEACPLDAVQVCTSNAEGVSVIEQAAARGIHAVVEKPMAATLRGAERMLSAAKKSGICLFINWPFRWRANVPRAWRLIQDGIIGHVFHARIRMAHKGPREFGCSDYFCDWLYDASRNGAGALVDYCCYGAVALRYLFGMPKAVQAVAGRFTKTDIAVEDNAAITLIYDDRYAVTEASWSQIPSYHDSVFLGTEGTLWTHNGKIILAKEEGMEEEISVKPLPADEQTGPQTFLKCLQTGIAPPDVCSAEISRDAQEILQAGLQAHESGQRVTLPLNS
ncbi:MAG: Gfo/Idh/MocA family oxidoreductase [Planctomycetaceae bacterium]